MERSSAVRRQLGTIRIAVRSGEISRAEAARRIVQVSEEFGLRPVELPATLEEITEDDLGVVCWLAVISE